MQKRTINPVDAQTLIPYMERIVEILDEATKDLPKEALIDLCTEIKMMAIDKFVETVWELDNAK